MARAHAPTSLPNRGRTLVAPIADLKRSNLHCARTVAGMS